MTRLKWLAVVLLMIGGVLAACGGNNAQEIFDTAELEELQNNPEHALSLYQEIVDKYPDSPLSAKAKKRIKALQGGSE